MKDNQYFFAVDLGATSGRTIIARIEDGKLKQEVLTRFANQLIQTGQHFYWDIYALYWEIIKGLKAAAKRGAGITSIGIDTWGVDFVCIGKDDAILRNPLAYRDPHTEHAMEQFFSTKVSREKVYETTGIQFMNFNSLFQLFAMRRDNDSALAAADKILFVPDALSWMLTGKKVCEYTIASTSQMLDPRTKKLDDGLLAAVGLTQQNFGEMVFPGHVVGTLTDEVRRITGLGAIPVVAVAGHDTGSAVAAVPATDKHFAYLSSGTWSLMGIETADPVITKQSYDLNFTNEGGIEGTTRYLKNICGMWLMECCRREWGDTVPQDYATLNAEAARQEPFRSIINPDDPSFANPPSMLQAIAGYCRKTGQPVPEGYAQTCRCIFDSLALRYRQVFGYLKATAPFEIHRLHVIGGGSLNDGLNQMTANATGVEVLAGPQECTAIGNIMLQAKAAGLVSDIYGMREIIANSVDIKHYTPADGQLWDKAYAKFIEITGKAG